jgi:cellulase
MTCYQLTVTGSGTLEPKGVTFPEAYSKTGPGLGFSIHADLDSYPAPGPELIAGGTEATPQLLTFGELAGAPAATATGGAAETPVASTPASVAASSTAAPATSSAAVEAEPSSVAPVEISSAVESSAAATSVAASSAAAPVESEAAPTPTPEVSSVVAPYPVANSTSSMLPGTASPIVTSSIVAAPTTMLTAVRPTQTAEASGPIKEYYQCGGQGFKGTSECAEGLECKEWNPWYAQCVKPEATKPGPSKGPMPSSTAASKPTATAVAPKPTAEAPKPSAAKPTSAAAAAEAEPTSVAPVAVEPSKPTASSVPAAGAGEKTYTLETFIAFLEQEAGSESAAKIRRMIEALQ